MGGKIAAEHDLINQELAQPLRGSCFWRDLLFLTAPIVTVVMATASAQGRHIMGCRLTRTSSVARSRGTCSVFDFITDNRGNVEGKANQRDMCLQV